MLDTNKKYSFLDYRGLSLFWSNIKTIIEDNELVTATALTNLDTRVDQLEDAASNQIIAITYLDLKTLKDNRQLVPGQQYRITDYQCTTTQANTKSAGHQFDIIVRADSENKLNEEASVIQHEGDEYFANNDLNAWKIWYSFDNDTNRFAWADSVSGKGVIYRMIDEWNNDVPYDFKNIQYNGSWGYWAYTFNWINDGGDNSCEDLSAAQYAHTNDEGGYSHTYGNVIKPCEDGKEINYGVPFNLNACVFLSTESYDSGCYYGCYCNTFGNGCYNNIFREGGYNNSFGEECHDNTFENSCSYNSFGDSCYNNSFGNDCHENAFGNDCHDNAFGAGCLFNSFGYSCGNNTFGNDCQNNTFGVNNGGNTFGDSCYCNSLGSSNGGNAFGTGCSFNSFGNYCIYIKFASDKSATTKYNYYQHNHFGDGCQYIVFTGEGTESSSQQVQNYNFAQGLCGTSSAYLTIDGVRGLDFETKVAKKSNGELKIYCEADLIL